MSYSVTPTLHTHADKQGLQALLLRVIYSRKKAYFNLQVKVSATQFDGRNIINHPNKKIINITILEKINQLESKLLERLRINENITVNELKDICKGKETNSDTSIFGYFELLQTELKGELGKGTLKRYNVLKQKITEYNKNLNWSDIDEDFPKNIERFIRNRKINGQGITVQDATLISNIKLIKAVFKRAKTARLLKENPFDNYKMPSMVEKDAEYLTQDEVKAFATITFALGNSALKRAGMYFLLSCYTGYRLGDSKIFDYEQRVKDGNLVLRAKKNGKLVSIPIYEELLPVLDYVKINPITLSENSIRENVKSIAKLAGIKKHVKFHTSRHSFGMMLTTLGLNIREVAQYLGDTEEVAKRYAQIVNIDTNAKFLELKKQG